MVADLQWSKCSCISKIKIKDGVLKKTQFVNWCLSYSNVFTTIKNGFAEMIKHGF